jgi:recombination protein RecT
LGNRSAQFVSSLVSMVNGSPELQKAFYEAPMTVIQAGLKAAAFDLPIDQNLGYAYIVPFKNSKKDADGNWTSKYEASFILGWKGMHQLALRTGAYKTINVVDIREGELKSYNRLTEEADVEFIEDDDLRETKPIIGYLGYYRLVNGAEKTIYMTIKQIENHEKKFRKGQYMGKGWRDDFDAMARKTVYRKLIGKWGVMSIQYQSAQEGATLAQQMQEEYIDNAPAMVIESEPVVDDSTGEVIENG